MNFGAYRLVSMPSPGTREQFESIIADKLNGYSILATAKRNGVSKATVTNYLRKYRQAKGLGHGSISVSQLGETNTLSTIAEDYKADLKRRSILALRTALDCPSNPYQAGRLAVDVLKGIGEFGQTQAQQGQGLAVLISAMPGELRAAIVADSRMLRGTQSDAGGGSPLPLPLSPTLSDSIDTE